jgi:hypothetical protein
MEIKKYETLTMLGDIQLTVLQVHKGCISDRLTVVVRSDKKHWWIINWLWWKKTRFMLWVGIKIPGSFDIQGNYRPENYLIQ